jgi:predicted Zn-dependent protease
VLFRYLVAAEHLAADVAQRPGRPAVHQAHGDVLCLLDQYEQGVAAYRIALRLDPFRREAMERMAVALFHSGAYAEAEPLLAELSGSKKDGTATWIKHVRADCLLALGRAGQARPIYAGLMEAEPGSVELPLALAKCDILENQFATAQATLQAVLARAPDHSEASALLGYLLLEAGRPAEAVPHLNVALRDKQLLRRETVERLLNLASNRPASGEKPAARPPQAAVPAAPPERGGRLSARESLEVR